MTRAGLHIARPADEPGWAGAERDRPPAPASGRAAPPRIDRPEGIRDVLLAQLDALYRFILVRVGFDHAIADDVLQQTAETALRTDGPRIAEVESVEGWLRGVARNIVRRYWRDAERHGPAPDGEAGRRALAALESGCPSDALAQLELRSALLWAIASLPAEEQWLLYAAYRHGRSQAELAAALGCSVKGIEMKLYRMRARLRDALAACGEDA